MRPETEKDFMLQSIKELYGKKLGASDGDLGQVKDFYFNDQNWAIRYLVADTGSWLPGRQVLLAPHSLGSLDATGKVLRVNLTRQQIEDSPSIEMHKPVSRQYEEEYYRYFGWPYYWRGDALWGMSGFPILQLPPEPHTVEPAAPGDPHLRSTQAVKGYHLQAREGIVGHVCDFLMDNRSWAIDRLVIKTGHRLSGKEVMISTKDVDRVSYEASTVFVNLNSGTILENLTPDLMPIAAAI